MFQQGSSLVSETSVIAFDCYCKQHAYAHHNFVKTVDLSAAKVYRQVCKVYHLKQFDDHCNSYLTAYHLASRGTLARFTIRCGLSRRCTAAVCLDRCGTFALTCVAAEAVTKACEDGCSFGALPSQFRYLPVCSCVKAMITFC